MAYILKPKDEEEREQGQGQTGWQQPPPVAQAPAPVGVPAQAPQSAPAPTAQSAGQGSGRTFPLLGRYLTANKGMGAGMAGAVAGGVSRAADQAQAGVSKAVDEFKGQVAAGTARMPQAHAAGGTAVPQGYGTGYTAGGYRETRDDKGRLTGYTATDAWQKVLDTELNYGGPMSITENKGYGTAVKQAAKATDMAGALNTTGGVRSLLQDTYGRQGPYSGGLGRLDAAMVGQDGQAAFADARSRFPQLSSALGDAVSGSRVLVGQAVAQSAVADQRRRAEQARAGELWDESVKRGTWLEGQDIANETRAGEMADAQRKADDKKRMEDAMARLTTPDFAEDARRARDLYWEAIWARNRQPKTGTSGAKDRERGPLLNK